jgi:hypothetical protein
MLDDREDNGRLVLETEQAKKKICREVDDGDDFTLLMTSVNE